MFCKQAHAIKTLQDISFIKFWGFRPYCRTTDLQDAS